MGKEQLRKAVQQFRENLGPEYTQSKLAHLLGVSYASIQRYEELVPPTGWVLLRYARLAEELGKSEFANLFRSALADEVIGALGKGKGFLTVQATGRGTVGGLLVAVLGSEEEVRCAWAFDQKLQRLRSGGERPPDSKAKQKIFETLLAGAKYQTEER
jgi:hypothetical protein